MDSLIEEKRIRAKLLDNIFSKVSSLNIQKISNYSSSAYYSYPLYLNDSRHRDKLLQTLKDKYNLHCAHGYANPTTLYQCVNALIDPQKYGKGFAYQNKTYPNGTSPNAEELLTRSFLIPFNENYTISETEEIGNRVVQAMKELKI